MDSNSCLCQDHFQDEAFVVSPSMAASAEYDKKGLHLNKWGNSMCINPANNYLPSSPSTSCAAFAKHRKLEVRWLTGVRVELCLCCTYDRSYIYLIRNALKFTNVPRELGYLLVYYAYTCPHVHVHACIDNDCIIMSIFSLCLFLMLRPWLFIGIGRVSGRERCEYSLSRSTAWSGGSSWGFTYHHCGHPDWFPTSNE